MLPLVIRRPCKLCVLGIEWNEKILKWLQEGVPYRQIADNLAAAGCRCVQSQVSKHKKHLLKALKETFQTQAEQQPSELEALRLQLRLEQERRAQMELARKGEERAYAAINALRGDLSAGTYERIRQMILEDIAANARP